MTPLGECLRAGVVVLRGRDESRPYGPGAGGFESRPYGIGGGRSTCFGDWEVNLQLYTVWIVHNHPVVITLRAFAGLRTKLSEARLHLLQPRCPQSDMVHPPSAPLRHVGIARLHAIE